VNSKSLIQSYSGWLGVSDMAMSLIYMQGSALLGVRLPHGLDELKGIQLYSAS
jgi:hypothetical protein